MRVCRPRATSVCLVPITFIISWDNLIRAIPHSMRLLQSRGTFGDSYERDLYFRATKLEVPGLAGLSIGLTWLEEINSISQINKEASGCLMNVDLEDIGSCNVDLRNI